MAQQNIIPGAEVFRFGQLVLHGRLQQLGTTQEQDIAAHRPLKRDGAIVEGLGWQPGRYEATCIFVGDTFRSDLQSTRDAIRKQSEDVLVHPLYGSIKVRCIRLSDAIEPPAAINAATLTLSFVEAGLDQQQLAQQAPSVAQKAQSLSDAAAVLEEAAAIYDLATVAEAVALGALADAYAVAAVAAMGGEPDPSLYAQALTIEGQTAATIAAILADNSAAADGGAVALDVDRWDAIAAAQAVWAATWEVQEAIGALRPPLVPHVVPAPIGYLPLLASLFGEDALDRESDFALWNPDLVTPHLIPAGTVVYLPPATA